MRILWIFFCKAPVLLAVIIASLSLFSCDSIVIESDPAPTIEIHSGYNVQLAASSSGQWRSDNPSVATVSATGLVTAVSAGKATIYTYSSSSDQQIVCYLEVNPRRNILFFIATDDNISSIDNDTPVKISRIQKGWKPEQGELLIYMDRKGQGASLLQINNTLTDGFYGVDTLEVYGPQNSADPEIMKGIINKVVSENPADSWGMIFFSHASGWLPEGMLNDPRSSAVDHPAEQFDAGKADLNVSPRSLVIDNGHGSSQEMKYADFASAIQNNQFDFIIFEACLMADVLVMYELRNKADYVMASSAEIVAPGFTSIYAGSVMGLFNTSKSVDEVLMEFASAYSRHYDTSFTMSILKMSEMNALAAVTKSVLKGKLIHESNLTIGAIQTFYKVRSSRKWSFFDLEQTIEELVSESDYRTFCNQIEKTVIWKDESNRTLYFPISRHCGLTTYIEQAAYPQLNAAFENSSWYNAIKP